MVQNTLIHRMWTCKVIKSCKTHWQPDDHDHNPRSQYTATPAARSPPKRGKPLEPAQCRASKIGEIAQNNRHNRHNWPILRHLWMGGGCLSDKQTEKRKNSGCARVRTTSNNAEDRHLSVLPLKLFPQNCIIFNSWTFCFIYLCGSDWSWCHRNGALGALMRIESDFEATPFLIICPLLALGGRETLRRKTFCYLTWG